MNNRAPTAMIAESGNAAEMPADDGLGMNIPPLLLQYWHIMLRRRWQLLGIIGTVFLIGILATVLMAPQYTAKVQLQIDRQQKQITSVAGVDSNESMRDVEFYATQYALLATRPLLERIVREFKLSNSSAFYEAHGINPAIIDEKVPGKSPALLEAKRRSLAVSLLADNVNISPTRNSRLVSINYTSRSPGLSAKIANKWASAFITISMDRQFASTFDARNFLEGRLADLRTKVEESERKVAIYASRSGIVAFDQIRDSEGNTLTNRTLTSTTLEQLSVALNQATADRIAAEVRAPGGGGDASEAVVSITLAELRQQRAKAAAD
jgi:succinoglycan biosynthesis transport protein ExoP